jgi:hypothetical protein
VPVFSFVVLLCSLSVLTVDSYDDSVQECQKEKLRLVNHSDRGSHFTETVCGFGSKPEIWSKFHSFLWLPVIYFLFKGRKFWGFAASLFLTFFPLIYFLCWFVRTQRLKLYQELFVINPTDNILYQSSSFDVVLFGLIAVFIVWQVIILLRFLLQQTRFDIPLP